MGRTWSLWMLITLPTLLAVKAAYPELSELESWMARIFIAAVLYYNCRDYTREDHR